MDTLTAMINITTVMEMGTADSYKSSEKDVLDWLRFIIYKDFVSGWGYTFSEQVVKDIHS